MTVQTTAQAGINLLLEGPKVLWAFLREFFHPLKTTGKACSPTHTTVSVSSQPSQSLGHLQVFSPWFLSYNKEKKSFPQSFPGHGQSLQVLRISWCSVVCCLCAWSWGKFLIHGLCCQPSELSSVQVYCPILSKGRGKMEGKAENKGHQGKIRHLWRPCSILLSLSKLFTHLLTQLSWQHGKWIKNVFVPPANSWNKSGGKRVPGELLSSCAPWQPPHHC